MPLKLPCTSIYAISIRIWEVFGYGTHSPMNLQTLSNQQRYLLSAGIVALLTLVLSLLPSSLEQSDIALLYLLAVLICATTFGRGPAIFVSVLAFVCSNFFFVSPRYTLAVENPQDVIQLCIFLIVAMVSGELAGRVRNQAATIAVRAREVTSLYSLSQAISAEVELDRILPIIARTTGEMLRVPGCQILLYDQHGLRSVQAAHGTVPPETAVVDMPIRAGTRVLGVLQVTQRHNRQPLSAADRERLSLIASQIVLVVERARLVNEVGTTRSLAESDRLKSVILASVSHDLRTPLAVIKGAVTSLLDDEIAWDTSARRELLATTNEETDHLNRLVGNVLEMSRIEAGSLSQTRSWQDIGELLDLALARLQPALAQHQLHVDLAPDLPPLMVNATQIDQVLTNLLENAARHTPAGTRITVTVSRQDAWVELVVQDQGPGIPATMTTQIFERFVRATAPERHATGSGLGLAIVKGLVEAHGGQIWAENARAGGARFVVRLPVRGS